MRIHSPNAHRKAARRSDFFFNYFTLGLVSDNFLMQVRLIKKEIIIHWVFTGCTVWFKNPTFKKNCTPYKLSRTLQFQYVSSMWISSTISTRQVSELKVFSYFYITFCNSLVKIVIDCHQMLVVWWMSHHHLSLSLHTVNGIQ